MGVGEKFQSFCANLTIGQAKRSVISTRYKGITRRLNADFWQQDSETMFSRYIGSYGRETAINNFSDLDMVFVLPEHIFSQYNAHLYNGQSALLQAVRSSISHTYPTTKIGADGIVVEVSFSDGLTFEVVPVFEQSNKSYKHPVASGGGSWKVFNPMSEIDAINSLDNKLNGNLKRLCRMARAWINHWNVPIGGLLIDTLAYNFMQNYSYKDKAFFYYDYYTRDFFNYLANQNPDQYYWYAPGSNQFVYRKQGFEYKAKRCYNIALEAITHEEKNQEWSANQKWREIYGNDFPA